MSGTAVRILDRFALPSQPESERLVIDRVLEAVRGCGLSADQLERLRTAVGEAAMNGIEHGNGNRAGVPVEVEVSASATGVAVAITDHGGGRPAGDAPLPDLVEKLAGRQSPRGWGLFLMRSMVDALDESVDGARHTVRLTMRAQPDDIDGSPGGSHAGEL